MVYTLRGSNQLCLHLKYCNVCTVSRCDAVSLRVVVAFARQALVHGAAFELKRVR